MIAVVAIASAATTAAAVIRAADVPRPFALIEPWAGVSPMAGLRCTAIVLDADHLATAAHCIADEASLLVADGGLCERVPGGAPAVAGATSAQLAAVRAGRDSVVVQVRGQLTAAPVRMAPLRSGPATVIGYGVIQDSGRPECAAQEYGGSVARCGRRDLADDWCLVAGAAEQICGGSSGAPVLMQDHGGWAAVGLVSRGPACGDEGPVVVVPIPAR